MKKALLVSTLVAAMGFATLSSAVQAVPLNKDLERDLVRICEALKSNKRLELYKAVKRSRLSYRTIGKGLVCNGHDAVTFAMLHSAENTASFMAHKAHMDVKEVVAKR